MAAANVYEKLMMPLTDAAKTTYPQGLTETQRNNLPRQHYRPVNTRVISEPTCPCNNKYKKCEKLVAFPKCGHRMHQGCANKWTERVGMCPYCNTNVF